MNLLKDIATRLKCLIGVIALASCSIIDDDLSDCGAEAELSYELRLVTNMTTELQTQLTTETDMRLAQDLRNHLSEIFTDFAHDVDLSFYDTQGDSLRLQHDQHIMNANQAFYTLYLPMRQYMHLAVANIQNNPLVSLVGDERCHQSTLLGEGYDTTATSTPDTINSHTTGIFTARQPMEVLEGVNQTFNVHLYMANCAATLIIDTVGSNIRDIRTYTTGFATAFNMADSTYSFSPTSPIVRAEEVRTDSPLDLMCFCSVNFPSPEVPLTRTIIETTEPFISPSQEDALWEFQVYATTANGDITESKLFVKTPLRAGQLKVVKAKVSNNGTLTTDNTTEVGVSVALNWKPGGTYEPDF